MTNADNNTGPPAQKTAGADQLLLELAFFHSFLAYLITVRLTATKN